MASGVYLIYNTENGRGYVGCTKQLKRRKQEHFTQLDNGEHHNPYLQHAYNHYGKDAFAFCVLELCDEKDLYKTEQKWIDKFIAEGKAYNINPTASEPPHTEETLLKASITRRGDNPITLLDENEVPHTFQNIAAFCRENGLSAPSFYDLINEKLEIHNGWHLPHWTKQEAERAISDRLSRLNGGGKAFILVSPEGEEHTVTNVAWFARERGLRQANLHRVVNGQRYHYKGWHLKGADLSKAIRLPGTEFTLISPEGKSYTFTSQVQFSKDHGLNFKGISSILCGKTRSYKGWCLPENVGCDTQKHAGMERVLVSPEGDVVCFSSARAFSEVHGLNCTCIYNVLSGKQNQHQGWKALVE